jgi:hypothetical protein
VNCNTDACGSGGSGSIDDTERLGVEWSTIIMHQFIFDFTSLAAE